MGTFSGPQAKGAKASSRERRRQEAERRNALTPLKRRRDYRVAQSKRQQRPKAEPQPVECQPAPDQTGHSPADSEAA